MNCARVAKIRKPLPDWSLAGVRCSSKRSTPATKSCEPNCGVAIEYDAFTSAQVYVFFTEADQHAKLTWSPKDGYKFVVYDNDLVHTGLNPTPSQTPLPVPSFP